MLVWFDDPHQYPDKLLDVTDLADYLGNKYGGWYDGPKSYATRDGKFIGLPLATIGNAIVYRESWVKEAGFSEFPKDTAEFPRALQGAAEDRPSGRLHAWPWRRRRQQLRALAAVEPWRQDGRRERQGRDQQPGDARRRSNMRTELYKTFIPGTESWLDVNNNRAFLAGELSVIANGVSAYYCGQEDRSEARRDRQGHPHHQPADRPGRQVGRAVPGDHARSSSNTRSIPNAAKAYLQFMFEEPQMNDWITKLQRLLLPDAEGLRQQSGLDRRSRTTRPMPRRRRRCGPTAMPARSAMPRPAVMADYVLVDMFAEAVTGQRDAAGSHGSAPRSAPTATTGSDRIAGGRRRPGHPSPASRIRADVIDHAA